MTTTQQSSSLLKLPGERLWWKIGMGSTIFKMGLVLVEIIGEMKCFISSFQSLRIVYLFHPFDRKIIQRKIILFVLDLAITMF